MKEWKTKKWRLEYNRKWRKEHPTYSRDFMRKKRGIKGFDKCGLCGTVLIMGIRVKPDGKA